MATFAASDGVRLHYAVDNYTDPWAAAPTLVLLHAAMGSLRRFSAWLPHLARDFRVVRLDTRGHGGSATPGPETALDIDRLARDVVELLDRLGVGRAHVAGASAGGYVAQHLGYAHAERVDRLALFSSAPGLSHSTVRLEEWLRLVRERGAGGLLEATIAARVDPAQVGAGFVRFMVEEAQAMDRAFTCRFLGVMAALDLSARLGGIRAPTLIVAAGGDTVNTPAGNALLRRIPRHTYVVYEGLPHNIANSAPARCAEDLRRFLLADGSAR